MLPSNLRLLTTLLALGIALLSMSTVAGSAPAGTSWADGPCPLIETPQYATKKDDIWTKGATHMALLHNAILRGFNTVYLQAPHIKDADKADFVGYSLAWFRFVKSHHDDEEAELFPKVEGVLNEKGIWEETHKEHESFLEGLGAYNTYLTSLSSPADFDGKELVRIMDTFREPFNDHFHSEIKTIATFADLPSAPAPDSPEAENASATFKAWGKKTLTKAGMTDVVPFCLLNLDRTYEEGMWATWPPMPGPIRWMMVNVFGSWNWGWWRFSSCDASGNPQPLYALQDGQGAEKKEEL
ncbi:putative hemerythrin hhe cation binding domain-containing protein [Diplodia seriata]|uniref:Putative hemerythrin hhe cation binding domain-containing protein n=1 Tax=Diplodia seriata TaxID=420778 RepID=A0A0G2EVP3_9PEZI|nr:putative hemerythrin hhe cation binding domain-containing protein [Diplodia seriata]